MSSDPSHSPNPVGVILPDGSRRAFPGPVTGAELAAAIGPGLANAAIAVYEELLFPEPAEAAPVPLAASA